MLRFLPDFHFYFHLFLLFFLCLFVVGAYSTGVATCLEQTNVAIMNRWDNRKIRYTYWEYLEKIYINWGNIRCRKRSQLAFFLISCFQELNLTAWAVKRTYHPHISTQAHNTNAEWPHACAWNSNWIWGVYKEAGDYNCTIWCSGTFIQYSSVRAIKERPPSSHSMRLNMKKDEEIIMLHLICGT